MSLLLLPLVDTLAVPREVGVHDIGVGVPDGIPAASRLATSHPSSDSVRPWGSSRTHGLPACAPRQRLLPSNWCTVKPFRTLMVLAAAPIRIGDPDPMAHQAQVREVEPGRRGKPGWRRVDLILEPLTSAVQPLWSLRRSPMLASSGSLARMPIATLLS